MIGSLSASTPESSGDETYASKHVDLLDDQVRNSGSDSPASGTVSEHQLADKKGPSSPQNLDTYADIGLVHTNSPSYNPSESQQEQDPPELPSFSVSLHFAFTRLWPLYQSVWTCCLFWLLTFRSLLFPDIIHRILWQICSYTPDLTS